MARCWYSSESVNLTICCVPRTQLSGLNVVWFSLGFFPRLVCCLYTGCGFVSLGIHVCLCPLPGLWADMGSGYRLSVTLYVGSGFGCWFACWYLLVFVSG